MTSSSGTTHLVAELAFGLSCRRGKFLNPAVQLLDTHKELPQWNPVLFLQHVGDVIVHCFSSIMMKHNLEVEYYTVQERLPSLASFRLVYLTLEVFPGDCVSLCLDNLVSGLVSFIQKKVCIELKDLCPDDISLCFCIIPCLLGIVKGCFGHLNYWRGGPLPSSFCALS